MVDFGLDRNFGLEAAAFLDFVLADNNFGDLEGVPLLFTEATPAPTQSSLLTVAEH